MRKMRIAHIHWTLGTGGTENMLVDIASIQSETEKVKIFILNDWVEQYMLDKLNPRCKVFLARRTPGSKNPLPVIRLNIELLRFKPDIIHVHANGMTNTIKVCKNVPIIRTSHGLRNPSPEFKKFNGLIAISKAVRDDMLSDGYDSIVIRNGIRVNNINITKNQNNDAKFHFVQVSRLHIETKAQDIVIEAIEKLRDEGITNICMHFIGDGPSEEQLKQMVIQKRLEDMTVFESRIEQQEIYKKLANYDLFIQPSRQEGFGLTIAEAMAAKVPVLVSDIAAPMEVIDDGRLGMHFHVNDAEDLANQIKSFIENGRNEKQIEEAYQYVVDHYDVAVTAKKYLEVYNAVKCGATYLS